MGAIALSSRSCIRTTWRGSFCSYGPSPFRVPTAKALLVQVRRCPHAYTRRLSLHIVLLGRLMLRITQLALAVASAALCLRGMSATKKTTSGTGSVLKTIRDKSRSDRSEQSRDDQGGWCPTIHHRTKTEQRTTKRGRGYQHTGGKWQSLRDWVVPRQQHVFLSLEHS